jgi:hypothetical protein
MTKYEHKSLWRLITACSALGLVATATALKQTPGCMPNPVCQVATDGITGNRAPTPTTEHPTGTVVYTTYLGGTVTSASAIAGVF